MHRLNPKFTLATRRGPSRQVLDSKTMTAPTLCRSLLHHRSMSHNDCARNRIQRRSRGRHDENGHAAPHKSRVGPPPFAMAVALQNSILHELDGREDTGEGEVCENRCSVGMLTCLSLRPRRRTSSMMVSRGGLPPRRASSSSRSRSRGSYAILLPPSNAEPAWRAGECGGSGREAAPPFAEAVPLKPQALSASSSPADEADAGTRRRERPAEELMA